jgi:hypothetical protein
LLVNQCHAAFFYANQSNLCIFYALFELVKNKKTIVIAFTGDSHIGEHLKSFAVARE